MGDRKILMGKYEIGELLGKGTFAKVYYGRHIVSEESVAIKIINKEQVKTEEMIQQILREISIMHLVRHPNVVELKEVMATKKKIHVVMEFVRGGELFAKIARGKLKEDVARKYFQQLVSAVEFCHSRGVFHRDLKPENLLLDENADLKVSDFGLSALSEHLRNDGLLHTQCGTPAYIAPEVLKSIGYDGAKADIWSCGVVLYVLLAGFLPFHDENVSAMYRKISKAEYGFPLWISYEAKSLISKLLVVDPDKRITIPEIKKIPWFKRNLATPNAFHMEESVFGNLEEDIKPGVMRKSPSSPAFLNAFELIASGFDLSMLFELKGRSGVMFTSRCSATLIVSKIEKVAKKLKIKVVKLIDFTLKLVGRPSEGRKGQLLVTVKVNKYAPEVTVVQFTKSSGDTQEFIKFCENIRQALKDIIWEWQGNTELTSDPNINNQERVQI
ncbi:hypothetical protein LIER_40266 [Lithospermum erythrorhizon]|uniref:non-specific serine/threonine protein kinase n=1 Tax=Lithospermum erythrorhizon TaxID=34254 RepID=A0AAV3QUG9_LITER